MKLDAQVPEGPLAEKWDRFLAHNRLLSPNNKKKYRVIVVGSGLAGSSAAASMAELGYKVDCFFFHDSTRRAHSVAAQGGINAAKNYQNDGDSVFRLFYDTIKGGDFRSREANVYRLAQVSRNIIDQCVIQGVPFARDYGGYLSNRSFGGAQVSRTFYCRGQTGQQLLYGANASLHRQAASGACQLHPRHEMLDLIVIDGVARGIVTRSLVTGEVRSHIGDAVVLATGGYSNVFFLSTNAAGCNVTAAWRAHKRGAAFANPCFTQIHPTCIPPTASYQSKLTLMSESLRNDGRVWVPKKEGDKRAPDQIPESERDYYLERKYPSYGNLAPRDISSRSAKEVNDEGRGVGPSRLGVYLDFAASIQAHGRDYISKRYSNLFEMYENITGENPYRVPMRIFPAPHYTMGGLWVDYNLMSTIPGLFVIGEANFSDHGANRLGASALMQGLADGYFVLPYTIGNFLATQKPVSVTAADSSECKSVEQEVAARLKALCDCAGKRTAESFHRELGKSLWENCGMARNAERLEATIGTVARLRQEYNENLTVTGTSDTLNQALERAGRVADFIELGELMCRDALDRNESCGAHFRTEHQTAEAEALRNDEEYCYSSAWEYSGPGQPHTLHKEPLAFTEVGLTQRSYK